ncbi:MAG: HelD family protein [Clostridium sp.]
MDKNIDFSFEKEHLGETLNVLNREIINYIEKRKYITQYIVDYRKKVIEEYKDDEDLVQEYFDHEAYVKEEAFRTIDRKLKEFTKLKEVPYFGKISFIENDSMPEDMYIGRFGLTPEETYEAVIVDWRAPVASLFYKGTLGTTTYDAPSGKIEADIVGRRQIIIKKGELKGVFDSALDVKDEILQMALTNNSSDKLKDIVMTIQEEQDKIIREDADKVIVVNGVAGSGKTTIALHRVSYLLYNQRKRFGDKILILGPNDIFMDYISSVLPSLGEDGIDNMTFEVFAKDEIGLEEEIVSFSYYMEEAMNGNEKNLKDFKEKSSKNFVEKLNDIVKELNETYFKIQEVKFFDKVIMNKDEIEDLFKNYYSKMPLFRRNEKIKRIIVSKIKDERDQTIRELNREIEEKLKDVKEEDLIFEKNDLDFKKRIRIREIIREVINARTALNSWIEREKTVDIYKRELDIEKITYMDLAGILYLMIKLEGKKTYKEYKHVVIDEAQDYSYMQYEIIKEMTGCQSMTIVGDKNQRLIETDEDVAMVNLDSIFKGKVQNYELNKSYRSTQEIMEYASRFLKEEKIIPLVRNGEKVLEENVESIDETVDTILSIIEDYEEEGLESIAIITKNKEALKEIAPRLKEKIKLLTFDRSDILYKGGKVIMPAYYAKGLEFDGVIILEDGTSPDLVKYIMATRALHRLSVIKNEELRMKN